MSIAYLTRRKKHGYANIKNYLFYDFLTFIFGTNKQKMKQLVLHDTSHRAIIRGIGVLMLVSCATFIIASDWDSVTDIIPPIGTFLAGLTGVTLNFGTLTNRITSDGAELVIRWNTKIFKKRISISDITAISTDDNVIAITLKSGSILRFGTRMMEPHERQSVRKFLRETTGF